MAIKYHFFPFDPTDVMSFVIMTDLKAHITLKNVVMAESLLHEIAKSEGRQSLVETCPFHFCCLSRWE